MFILRVVMLNALLLLGASAVRSLAAEEQRMPDGGLFPADRITLRYLAETDKPRMTPDIAIPTEAEAETGVVESLDINRRLKALRIWHTPLADEDDLPDALDDLPDTLNAESWREAVRLRREAMLARRILSAFLAERVELRDRDAPMIKHRVYHPSWRYLACCAGLRGVCALHRYMTMAEYREAIRDIIGMDDLIRKIWPAPENHRPGDLRMLLDDVRRDKKELGVRYVWGMLFNSEQIDEDNTGSAKERAEAAFKRLEEGDPWELVAIEDSDNARSNSNEDGVLGPVAQWGIMPRTLWDTLAPGEVSDPQQGNGCWFLTKWKPLDDEYLLDQAKGYYRNLQKFAWRKAALAAAAEALRPIGESAGVNLLDEIESSPDVGVKSKIADPPAPPQDKGIAEESTEEGGK